MSIEAQLLYLLTIPHLDRDGLTTGDPVLLWAQSAPKRLELLDNAPRLIAEWLERNLVTRYTWKDGPILFFPGFRKHNSSMEYTKEQPSRYPPPPGYIRTPLGLVPDNPDACLRLAQEHSTNSAFYRTLMEQAAHDTPKRKTKSGVSRDKVETTSRKSLREDQDQDQDQDQTYLDDDDERLAPYEFDDMNENRRNAITTLQQWCIAEAGQLQSWHGSAEFLKSLDQDQLLAATTWVYLYLVLHDTDHYEAEAARQRYRNDNPFDGVKNTVGRIITQSRLAHPARLHEYDLRNLHAELIQSTTPDVATQIEYLLFGQPEKT